jgi:hypothetical protein
MPNVVVAEIIMTISTYGCRLVLNPGLPHFVWFMIARQINLGHRLSITGIRP